MPLPFIISIPHCGHQVPDAIRSDMVLDALQIAESIDFGTHEIFSGLPAHAVIAARWSRLVVDLNRSPDQRDAKGVVALADYYGRSIYREGRRPTPDEVLDRLERFHHPYHSRLTLALNQTPTAALIDCHSLNGIGPPDAPDPGRRRKDVILSNNGDPNGKERPAGPPLTCAPEMLHCFKEAFEANAFSVALNTPYKGGYIIKHHGRRLVAEGRFAMQIEMNQSLYASADGFTPDADRIAQVARSVERALNHTAAIISRGVHA